MGLVITGAAERFGVEITSMAAQFTWFTGGIFAGYIFSFVVFDYLSIKRAVVGSYFACIAALVTIHFTSNFAVFGLLLAIYGVSISIAICGSGTLITRLWSGKARQTVIVSQDAMFNAGGVIFSAVATWFITNNFPFSSTYLAVAAVILFVVLLSFVSDFQSELIIDVSDSQNIETEWNLGIISIGVSLLLFLLAKISIFIWAPQYVEQRFDVDGSVSGQFMSNIFIAALIGSLAGAWLVSRYNVKYLLFSLVAISASSVWVLTEVPSVDAALILAFVYGISVSATYNAYVAFALTFVSVPTHRNIAYMLLMSALGSSGAPYFSSLAVEVGGRIESALTFCFVTLLVAFASLIVGEVVNKQNRKFGPPIADPGS